MDRERLDQLILIHGPDLASWPPADAESASALLERDAAARKLLEEYRSDAAALSRSLALAPDGDLAARIAGALQAGPRPFFATLRAGPIAALTAGGLTMAGAGYGAAALVLPALLSADPLLALVTGSAGLGITP